MLGVVGIGIYYLAKVVAARGILDVFVVGFVLVSLFLILKLTIYARTESVWGK